MRERNPTWAEVFTRAYLLCLGQMVTIVTAERLIQMVTTAAPLHGIPTGYNRRTPDYRIERAKQWLKEKSAAVKLVQHSHLEKVLLAEAYCPGGSFYDTCFGALALTRDDDDKPVWQRSTASSGRAVVLPIGDEETIVKALVALAVHHRCAVTVPHPTSRYGGVQIHDRTLLTASSEMRFSHGGDCRPVKGLETGTALLFLNEPEMTGRLIIEEDRHGIRRYGAVVLPGSFYALQLVEAGFEPLNKQVPLA